MGQPENLCRGASLGGLTPLLEAITTLQVLLPFGLSELVSFLDHTIELSKCVCVRVCACVCVRVCVCARSRARRCIRTISGVCVCV